MTDAGTADGPPARQPDDFVGCLAGNLRAVTRAVTRAYDDALRPHGLRITQLALLAHLERLQPTTTIDLADAVGAERSGVARDLARLARRHLVDLQWDRDRRARVVTLTGAGADALRACAPTWREMQRSMASLLGPRELAELVAASARTAHLLAHGDRP